MSRVAIMQPYFFPYLGYFQLIHSVDSFVFYDDVNFITRGWINRNRILINGNPKYITVPLIKASQNKKINEVHINYQEKWQRRMLRSLELAYRNSPYFDSTYPCIEHVILSRHETIADLAVSSVKAISNNLGLDVTFKFSSQDSPDTLGLDKADRLITITKENGAFEYLNPQGGKELYAKDYFGKHNIKLFFLNTRLKSYTQFGNEFMSGLSIIDVLMFNGPKKTKELLQQYDVQ